MNQIEEHAKVARWLRNKREEAGLTQAQLAKLIGHHTSFVGRYEAGHRLEIVQFFKIVSALNAKPDEAFASCFIKGKD